MGYKDHFDKDPWPDECPDPALLSPKELLAIVGCWPHAELSSWEQNFCGSLEQRLKKHQEPSEKQVEVLQKHGLFRRLYDADPALWEGL